MRITNALPLAGEKTVSGCPGHFFINTGTYCGDMKMKRTDLTGKIFGRWTVLAESIKKNHENVYWLCKCACGERRFVRAGHLTCGSSQSCGCLNETKPKNRKHCHSLVIDGKQQLSREYVSWKAMKQRCMSPDYTFYKNYGGRGIAVCPEWRNDFSQFLKDMGPRPDGMSLDRIDNELGYSAINCRWADRLTQRHNRRPIDKRKQRC